MYFTTNDRPSVSSGVNRVVSREKLEAETMALAQDIADGGPEHIDEVSEPLTIVKYDLEISGFGSQSLGHVCLLNLKEQEYPGSEGTKTKGWPTWTTPVLMAEVQQSSDATFRLFDWNRPGPDGPE